MSLRWISSLFFSVHVLILAGAGAHAGVPITLQQTFAGNVNFVGTGGTLRRSADGTDACRLRNRGNGTLTDVPGGATILAAYLYWAGSGSTVDAAVRFEGSNITADRTFTETFNFGGIAFDFFSGFEDVTDLVRGKANPNTTYDMRNLSVDNGGNYCNFQAVLSGWSMVVIYEHPSEDFRVLNVFDGFQFFRGSSISLTPSNFVTPVSPLNGKIGYISWEGDPGNSAALNGFSERVVVEGSILEDPPTNPDGAQFNGTITDEVTGTSVTNRHGVDFDIYDLSPFLSAGMSSLATSYSSGGDLVLLSAEVVSVTNTPVADLAIDKRHSADFTTSLNGAFEIEVTNNGPNDATAIQITDTLPASLSYVSASGSGWTCGAAGQTVTCTHPGPLSAGNSLPVIDLIVGAPAVAGTVTNTAATSSAVFDATAANNSDTDVVTVVAGASPDILLLKSARVLSDSVNGAIRPKALPGAFVEYTVQVSNQGAGEADAGTVVITDALPAAGAMFVGDIDGPGSGPVRFVDGSGSAISGLTYDPATDITYSRDGGGSFGSLLIPDGVGYDDGVTHFQIRPTGPFNAAGPGTPQFSLVYRVRIDP